MKKTSKEEWIKVIENNPPELIADLILKDAKEIHNLRKGRQQMASELAQERKRNKKAIECMNSSQEILDTCNIYDVNGIEVYKILKGVDKE